MSEEVLERLREYGARLAEKEAIELPLQAQSGQVRVLICSGENIEEMLEEAADGEESIRPYVEKQTQAAEGLSAEQALHGLADAVIAEMGGGGEIASERGSGLNDSYRAYAAQWEDGIAMLDEQVPAAADRGAQASAALPDLAWIERHEDDGLLLLDLPEKQAWTTPLIVPMGGYNECPQPLEQAVMFRDWQRRFGALPAAVTEDSWLLRVKRRPETDEEALDLAKEHFIFCQYVLESFETIGQYAAYLKAAHTWEFWWD